MSQEISEQVNTIERALGERMVHHALAIIRSWLNELGENNPYEEAFKDIHLKCDELFSNWLVTDNKEEQDEQLNALTGDTYRLTDAVYASLRLARGISPLMRGFNKDSIPSVMHYFSSCLEFKQEDFAWLQDCINSSEHAGIALMAISALSKNLRECFSERAMLALIEGINGANAVVAEQCVANVILLFAHYDVRIDFFPNLQDAFVEALANMDDAGKQVFETMCALVRSVGYNWLESYAAGEIAFKDLPGELQSLMEITGAKNELNSFASWIPASENEYIAGVVQILPNTWVYELMVEDDTERARIMALLYLSIGNMELVWDKIDLAEEWLVAKLRRGKAEAIHYLHYGHCLLLKGDRMMAFEAYRQARQLCKSTKEFYALFRPDRRALVDRGVPVENIYFIEDQLLTE